MPALAWIFLATLFGGLLSAALAGLFLRFPEARRARALPHLISFATGAMLAAALIGLLPEAIAAVGTGAGAGDRGGAFGGYRAVLRPGETRALAPLPYRGLREPPGARDEHRDRAAGWIVLIGDGVHNGFDGVLIAAAFLTDVRLGILATIAITAHEIPQELGDLAVLLHARHEAVRALMLQYRQQPDLDHRRAGGLLALKGTLDVLPYADFSRGGIADLRGGGGSDPGAPPARGPGREP